MIKKAWLLILVALCAPTLAAPKAELWAYWQAQDAASQSTVAHNIWGNFLQKYLVHQDGIALLDYAAIADVDKQSLDDYLALLAETKPRTLNRAEQRAYWINLYNALTVHTVLQHYPIDSIRDISSGLFSFGPWDDKLITVEDKALSLNDIEHRILRPIWQDARLHYAVNCASIGCPNLVLSAYTAANSEEMLDAAAAAYINHSRGVRLQNGRLYVSSIYEWFKEDFGGDDLSVIAHLQHYAEPRLQEQLGKISAISGDDYNWALNDTKDGER